MNETCQVEAPNPVFGQPKLSLSSDLLDRRLLTPTLMHSQSNHGLACPTASDGVQGACSLRFPLGGRKGGHVC